MQEQLSKFLLTVSASTRADKCCWPSEGIHSCLHVYDTYGERLIIDELPRQSWESVMSNSYFINTKWCRLAIQLRQYHKYATVRRMRASILALYAWPDTNSDMRTFPAFKDIILTTSNSYRHVKRWSKCVLRGREDRSIHANGVMGNWSFPFSLCLVDL